MSFIDRAKTAFSHYAYTEGRNPDPASYAVQTLNSIIHDNDTNDWHPIYMGARAGFRRIFECFDEFPYKHIEGLHVISGNLGDRLMYYCGHDNLFMRNGDELPELVKTGHDIVDKLLKDPQFQTFCEKIDPFRKPQIDYSKHDFKAALFMHNDLKSFMNALFVDTKPIKTPIEEGIRPIKCWLSMFFSEETFSKISRNVRKERLHKLALPHKKDFLGYPDTIVQKVIAAMELRGFGSSSHSRVRSSSSSSISSSSHSRSRSRSRSRGGAHKRTARVPRKQRKQCKSRKQRK